MKIISLKEMEKEFAYNYFMYIPLTIIINSCLGSLVAMKLLAHGVTLFSGIGLTICVSLCMGYNAALLAGIKRSFAFKLLIASLVVNIILLLLTLF